MNSIQKSHVYTMIVSVILSVTVSLLIITFVYFLFLNQGEDIDLNNATREELELINGIGPKKSEFIISNRPYTSKYDIISIDGIGLDLFKKIESEVTVE